MKHLVLFEKFGPMVDMGKNVGPYTLCVTIDKSKEAAAEAALTAAKLPWRTEPAADKSKLDIFIPKDVHEEAKKALEPLQEGFEETYGTAILDQDKEKE